LIGSLKLELEQESGEVKKKVVREEKGNEHGMGRTCISLAGQEIHNFFRQGEY